MCTAPLVHRSTSVEGMGKVKLKTFKQLYTGCEAASLLTKRSNFQMEEKSQKCNLCATRCTLYMHCERVAAIVGVGTGDFTKKASQENEPIRRYSDDGTPLSHSLNCVCECRQHISSEASNIFSVSSHKSFSEIAESQAIVRVSDPYEDFKKAESAGEFGDSPKGLTKFDTNGFSNQLQKHKELDILVDNVSCIGGSDSTFLTIDATHFDRAYENHCDIQNFTENSPPEGVVYPSFFDCAISPKGEHFECSGEQERSTPARVAISGFSGQIDGVYNYPTFWRDHSHLNSEDSAVETELHLYCKKHLQKFPAVIENTSMQGQQPQPVDIVDLSDLMEEEVRVCDICGDVGLEELLAICSKCADGAEHTYCMRIKLDKVPEGDWICEECILRIDTEKAAQDKVEETTRKSIGRLECQKSGNSVNIESRISSKIKSKSSCAGRKGTNDVNSMSLLPAKRHGAPSQVHSVKKVRTIGTRAVLLRSSKPCNSSLLHEDTSLKNSKKKELKATKEITSVLQLSCNASEKVKVPSAHGDKGCVETSKSESNKQTRDLETEIISPKTSNTNNNSLLHRDASFKNLKKDQMKVSKQITSDRQISCKAQEKAEVPSASGDKRRAETLKAELDKKKRDLQMTVTSPKESNTINNPLLHRDTTFKNLKNGKMKASKEITSEVQISCNAQEKANVPSACDDDKSLETLETELDKRRNVEEKVISPNASHLINHSLLSGKAPLENLEKEKADAAHNVSSLEKSYYGTQEKAQLSSILGVKSPKSRSQSKILLDECSLLKSKSSNTAYLKLKGQLAKGFLLKSMSSNAADLKLKGELAKAGSSQKLTIVRNPNFQDKKSQTDSRTLSKSLSLNSVRCDKLNAMSSEVLLTNADHSESETLKKLGHAKETHTVKGKSISELYNPVMGLTASDLGITTLKSKKESLPYDDTFISESNCHKLDSVQSCGLLNYSLDPSSNISHKPASDEGFCQRNLPQFEAAFFSRAFVIPKPDYIWLGKFQLYSSEGLTRSCDGIQAHLSTFASPKVLEVVDKLPEIIILEELPRLRTWPSQFVEHQATEENIALYFFATDLDSYRTHYSRLLECMTKNDLALRGNLDGVDLLIFPSNLLPEESQRWNGLLFLWGVFRGRKVCNSANIQLSNSLKVLTQEKNRDSETIPFDHSAYPQDGEDTEGVDVDNSLSEIRTFDSSGTRSSGDGCSSGLTDLRQAIDNGEIKSLVVDLDLPLRHKSGGLELSTGIGDNRTNEEPTVDVLEASMSGSHDQNLETDEGTKELLLEWQAANTLISLSKGFGKM